MTLRPRPISPTGRTRRISAGPAPLPAAQSVRRAVSEVDPAIPVDRLRTMEQQIDLSLSSEHIMAELVSAFGLAAALLAAIGLYGVMAYTVARRTSEIGIRMAFGANGRSVAWLVVRESVAMVAAGMAIGVPAALALGRFVRSMLYSVAPNDPWSFIAAVLLLAAAGAAAAYFPARRASRLDPMTALRND
jgi:ABC-type antimicrobial peptide transport system permease subunit